MSQDSIQLRDFASRSVSDQVTAVLLMPPRLDCSRARHHKGRAFAGLRLAGRLALVVKRTQAVTRYDQKASSRERLDLNPHRHLSRDHVGPLQFLMQVPDPVRQLLIFSLHAGQNMGSSACTYAA